MGDAASRIEKCEIAVGRFLSLVDTGTRAPNQTNVNLMCGNYWHRTFHTIIYLRGLPAPSISRTDGSDRILPVGDPLNWLLVSIEAA